ncbi:SH3 domain-binding protein 2 isoform X2 [Bombina bombina]|uniref:SH3 domain-binding protein 2 isoform X2 n=1 Tax=Bombina bombina TaxID=8345 RepID=UPI00235B1E36|nr:SH3 domain-binding protein 2 isoform X2 [Bombina bombina]
MATSIKRSQSLAVSFERRTMCRLSTRTMASAENNWPTPMKAIGAQNLLTMPGGVTLSGYLHKRGGKQIQLLKWPLRYVIIHKGCVYYFKSSTSPSSQGAFSLNGYNRVMRAAEETTSSNVFPFKLVHISKKHRTWYFSAASEDERKKWMLSLRKEIDHYHEKKEAVTDLSDTDSDSSSFYGSVERPVDIKYIHNPVEDSWQDDDDDDDEDDYEKPDGFIEDDAPLDPPPPVPRTVKDVDEKKRRAISDLTGLTKPPPPHPKNSLPNPKLTDWSYTRKDSNSFSNQNVHAPSSNTTPGPPLPSPIYKPPLPPPKKTLPDLKDFSVSSNCFSPNLSETGTRPQHVALQTPSNRLMGSSTLTPLKSALNNSETKGGKLGPQQSCDAGISSINKELNEKLRSVSFSGSAFSPIPPPKPASQISAVSPNKSPHLSPPAPPTKPVFQSSLSPPTKAIGPTPPVPPMKPRTAGASSEVNSLKDVAKSGVLKPSMLQKPPTIPRLTTKIPESDKPGFSPILRSPPDGQSFRGFGLEIPVRPPKNSLNKEDSDSDEDYEKVPLPASVFINTNESTEVERIFKDTNPKGSPLNGLFCFRNSSKAGKVLVVWDTAADRVRNYRIFEKDSKVYLEAEIMFPDIGTLVEHYYANKLPSHDNLLLKHAYGCATPPR